jgi:hypothetical protein
METTPAIVDTTVATGAKELSGKEAKKARRAEKTAQKAGDPAVQNLSVDASTSVASPGSSIPVRAPRPPTQPQQQHHNQQQQQQQRGGTSNGASVSSSSSSLTSLSLSEAISTALDAERLSARTSWHSYFPRCGSNSASAPPILHAIFKAQTVLGVFSSPLSGSSEKAKALLQASRAFAFAFTAADGTSFPRELYKALQIQFSALALAVTGGSSSTTSSSSFYFPSELVILRAIRSFVSRLNPAMDAKSSRNAFSASIDAFITKRLSVVTTVRDSLSSLLLLRSSSSISGEKSDQNNNTSSLSIKSSRPVIALYASPDSNLTEDAIIDLVKGAGTIVDNLTLVIIDSRPLHMGKNTLLKIKEAVGVNVLLDVNEVDTERLLVQKDGSGGVINVTYTFLNGFDHLLRMGGGGRRKCTNAPLTSFVDLLLIPAASVLGDGRVISSAGAATAAALANRAGVPVYAVAESYKFTEKIAIDSLSINSVGNPSLILSSRPKGVVALQPQSKVKPVEGKDPLAGISIPFEDEGVFSNTPSPVTPSPSLCVLPLLFDLSAKGHITGYVTERGMVVGQSEQFKDFVDKLLKEQLADEQGDADEEEDENDNEDDENDGDDDDDDDVEDEKE